MTCTATEAGARCVLDEGHDPPHVWEDARSFRIRCEWPSHLPDCPEPVVAAVGVPSRRSLWVCARGFDDYEQRYRAGA